MSDPSQQRVFIVLQQAELIPAQSPVAPALEYLHLLHGADRSVEAALGSYGGLLGQLGRPF